MISVKQFVSAALDFSTLYDGVLDQYKDESIQVTRCRVGCMKLTIWYFYADDAAGRYDALTASDFF